MMVKKIFKYKLEPLSTIQEINLPWDAEILDVQMQEAVGRRGLCLWAVVDPAKENLIRKFQIFGTGWPLPYRFVNKYKHLKTIQDGSFVWHVFEVIGE